MRALAASRILLYPNLSRQFAQLNILEKLKHPTRIQDPYYFVSYRKYLFNSFDVRQRIASALTHHRYEDWTFIDAYAQTVYRGEGILLWERIVDTNRATMTLVASEDNRHEGEISVILAINDAKICRMAFAYVDGETFNAAPGRTILISRNQTECSPERDVFNKMFKQCTPQIFCLWAVCGVAMANGFDHILAVKHDSQIFFKKGCELSFRNTYDALWEKFAASEVCGRVYQLEAPLPLRPLEEVPRAHRSRARFRRGCWEEIRAGAREAMARYRTAAAESRPGRGSMRSAAAIEPPREAGPPPVRRPALQRSGASL
jgi:uncharacterized protein VirK/YbjX